MVLATLLIDGAAVDEVLVGVRTQEERSGRRVSAAIAGEGPESAPLKAQAQRLEVADQVRFIGYCPAREAQRIKPIDTRGG
jgi:hypothetical protein